MEEKKISFEDIGGKKVDRPEAAKPISFEGVGGKSASEKPSRQFAEIGGIERHAGTSQDSTAEKVAGIDFSEAGGTVVLPARARK